jgi:hypothetical protein
VRQTAAELCVVLRSFLLSTISRLLVMAGMPSSLHPVVCADSQPEKICAPHASLMYSLVYFVFFVDGVQSLRFIRGAPLIRG